MYATARTTTMTTSLSETGIKTFSLELTDPESIAPLHSQIQRSVDGHGLVILVNNAGKDCIMPALDLDINEAGEMFEVNLFTVMSICQTFAPMLSEQRGES